MLILVGFRLVFYWRASGPTQRLIFLAQLRGFLVTLGYFDTMTSHIHKRQFGFVTAESWIVALVIFIAIFGSMLVIK